MEWDTACPIGKNRAFAHFVSCSFLKTGGMLRPERRSATYGSCENRKFLQELRKENGLTQEQLAERMGVARRTVSRWETGSNMPDLDLLIELSDLYETDLREILSGERKSERMNKELKETVMQVADYSGEEKARLTRRMHGMFIAHDLHQQVCVPDPGIQAQIAAQRKNGRLTSARSTGAGAAAPAPVLFRDMRPGVDSCADSIYNGHE